MKKINLFVINSVLVAIGINLLICCDPESLPLPTYEIAKVLKCERDSITTIMSYGKEGVIDYHQYIHGDSRGKSGVRYTLGTIHCTINGIEYNIQLSNTKGSSRMESLEARISGAILYSVKYSFDDQNRLVQALVGGVLKTPVYVTYKYSGNSIIINDGSGSNHTLTLSSDKNLGNVCNVLDFSGSWLTSNFVMNPDLYFLNIYGAPIANLPADQEIEYTDDHQRLKRVGKYTYDY